MVSRKSFVVLRFIVSHYSHSRTWSFSCPPLPIIIGTAMIAYR